MKRFIVKKVKIVWRNSMLAGNPIERSFTKFGVFDRNQENDRFCYCPRPGGEWATNNGQSRKYRLVVDDEAKANRIAAKLNELVSMVHNGDTSEVDFGVAWTGGINRLSTYIADDKISYICISRTICK